MAYWACAQTEPQREAAAMHFLQLGGYTVYLPRLRVVRPRRGRKVTLCPALFPSYLFVLITSGWWAARWPSCGPPSRRRRRTNARSRRHC